LAKGTLIMQETALPKVQIRNLQGGRNRQRPVSGHPLQNKSSLLRRTLQKRKERNVVRSFGGGKKDPGSDHISANREGGGENRKHLSQKDGIGRGRCVLQPMEGGDVTEPTLCGKAITIHGRQPAIRPKRMREVPTYRGGVKSGA